ncbi:MAG: NAD(+) diphosphatase [Oscillospiraceae bacterium]|jgi:NAD+ diphosphatase|nr:NAD(+) diphosphatase [Oscillospiraceae bacterium]
MLHEISPKVYHVEYHDVTPEPNDTVIIFEGGAVYYRDDAGVVTFPKFGELTNTEGVKFRYLFAIDDERFFMPDVHNTLPCNAPEGYAKQDGGVFRIANPRHLAFAGITAQQLNQWYNSRRYCGRCGAENGHSDTERATQCPKCGLIEYPKISPVVIVAVHNGDDLLVTRYAGGPYSRYALVAGFAEIGESLEDTVRREVLEETGIHVKNLKYYKSQPWGFSSSLLSGFFCELDGDPTITVDTSELSEAIWLPRAEVPPLDNSIALTAEMMDVFRQGKELR